MLSNAIKSIAFILLMMLGYTGTGAQSNYTDSLLKELNDARGLDKLNILNRLSDYYSASNLDLSLAYDSIALDIAIKEKDTAAQSNILNNMGLSFYAKSDVATAITLISQSLELKELIADSLEIDKTLNNLGVLYQIIGDFDTATEFLKRSLHIRKEQNDLPGMARSLSNTSVLLKKAGRMDESLAMLEEAKKIYTELDDEQGLASVYNNKGTVYQKLNDFKQAERYFLLSVELKDEDKEPRFLANTYNNLGMISMARGNYDQAEQYYLKALEIRTRINDVFGLTTVNVNLGELHRLSKRYTASEKHLLQALAILEQEGFKEPLQRCLHQLSLLYAELGRYEKAYQHAVRAAVLREEIYTDDLQQLISNLETQRKTEVTYRENIMLRMDNELKELTIRRNRFTTTMIVLFAALVLLFATIVWFRLREIRRLNSELEKAVGMLKISEHNLKSAIEAKDKLFSIIAHDLIGPFNAILGFSEMLLNTYDSFSEKERKRFVANIHEASSGTYKLLQNLLDWSRSQTGKLSYNPELFDLSALVEEGIKAVSESAANKNIDIEADVAKGSMVFADNNMVYTVIRNLLSNAIKFTPREGNIKIGAKTQNSHLQVFISDNGVGIPRVWQSKIFDINKEHKRPGTEKEQGTGLGLILCAELVKRNGGTIWVESEEGKGSTFYFTLKTDAE